MLTSLSDLVAQLQRVEHFRHLPETDLTAIISAGRVRRFVEGETIFGEDELCAGMMVRDVDALARLATQSQRP